MTKPTKRPEVYGAICLAGGRRIEITSVHAESLDWALTTLYTAAAKEAKQFHGSIAERV